MYNNFVQHMMVVEDWVMQPYLETLGVIGLAILGLMLGWFFSRLRRPYWAVGYFISLILAGLLVLGRFVYDINFIWPFNVLLASRFRFVVLTLSVTIGLASPLGRLPHRMERLLVCMVLSLVLVWFGIMPFLAPALVRDQLQSIKPHIDSQGVCFQSTDYTCGPAAAATALRRLGFEADEGRLAILAHSSPVIGTLPKCLADVLNREYGRAGLSCAFKKFSSVEQLKEADITLAVVRDRFLSDHCVAVLEVRDGRVIIADPVSGLEAITYEQFARMWRFSGIALRNKGSKDI